jgi:hypothetical protein
MKVNFLKSAHIEYKEAVEFYSLQSDQLGERFINEVDKTISIIKNYPESFNKFTEHTRKAVVNIFPYSLFYSIINENIEIIAVAHQNRKPNYWKNRKDIS